MELAGNKAEGEGEEAATAVGCPSESVRMMHANLGVSAVTCVCKIGSRVSLLW